ncbi:MAG: alpha/beta fold hydrolase, partial [Xanthomonadaceae bacterium]|nr:alpha/beta fold hydrolase [Xanthomonadaceae bacterium]
GISADRCVSNWWQPMTEADAALNDRHCRKLSLDWLTQGRVGTGSISTAEQADALAALLNALGIDRVDGVVGASYGAMIGLAFAARHGDRLKRLVAISGAHRSTPAASAIRILQREIIRSAIARGDSRSGVALARALALTTYRPDALINERFYHAEPAETVRELEGYLMVNGHRFAEHFDADRYLALSASLDSHLVDPNEIRCPTDLISVDSDALVPPAQLRSLACAIGLHARVHSIDSPFGHDAFLKSPELIGPLLQRCLALDVPGNRFTRAHGDSQ